MFCKQNLESVRLYFNCDKILDELGAKGACWQNNVFLHSLYSNTETLLHEIAHAAQWLKFGNSETGLNNTVSVKEDSCEEEARHFARFYGRENRHFPLTHPCSASVMLDPVSEHLLVDCQIIGHASPRWKTAKTEQQRIENNQVLALKRANAVQQYFETQLRKNLSKFSLKFRYNQTFANDDAVPSGTVVIGTQSRGQQDSIVATGGNKKSVDPNYQRVDLSIRIARKTTEIYPTKVKHVYNQYTKTKFWYVSVGILRWFN